MAAKNPIAYLIYMAFTQFSEVDYDLSGNGKTEKDFALNIAFTIDHNGSIEITSPIGITTPDPTVSTDVQNTHTITLKFLMFPKKNKAS